MTCDPNTLLVDGRCFYAMNSFTLQAVIAQLWCNIGQVIHGGTTTLINPVILSDDGNWYQISAVDYGEGDASMSIGDDPQPPGTHPYLVLVNVDDGLRYKLSLTGTPPSISYTIDETPTLEDITPTILTDGLAEFALNIAAGLTIELTPTSTVLTDPVIQSDDGNWYQLSAIDMGGGEGVLSISDTPQPPGARQYLVLLNVDDGLKYKLTLTGTPPSITYAITESPILAGLTPTILTDGATQFTLNTADGLTIELTQI